MKCNDPVKCIAYLFSFSQLRFLIIILTESKPKKTLPFSVSLFCIIRMGLKKSMKTEFKKMLSHQLVKLYRILRINPHCVTSSCPYVKQM